MPVWIADFLANKIVAPLAICLSVLFLIALGVQTVRINGISVFGWYAIDGYKPMYERLVAANEQAEFDGIKASLDMAKKQGIAMADGNSAFLKAQFTADQRIKSLQDRINDYVPQALRTACVPLKLAVYLDKAGSGLSESDPPSASGIPDSVCSDISVPDAASRLVYDLGLISKLSSRIENARNSWQDQQRIINGDTK